MRPLAVYNREQRPIPAEIPTSAGYSEGCNPDKAVTAMTLKIYTKHTSDRGSPHLWLRDTITVWFGIMEAAKLELEAAECAEESPMASPGDSPPRRREADAMQVGYLADATGVCGFSVPSNYSSRWRTAIHGETQ
jgi:hypothetical protein